MDIVKLNGKKSLISLFAVFIANLIEQMIMWELFATAAVDHGATQCCY